MKRIFKMPIIILLIPLSFNLLAQETPQVDVFNKLIDKGKTLKFKTPNVAQLYYDSARILLINNKLDLPKKKYTEMEALLLKNEGILASIKNDFDGAKEKLDQSKKNYLLIQDTFGLASVYSNMGVVNYYLGAFTPALEYFKKGAKLYKLIANNKQYLDELARIAVIYHYTQKYDSAIYFNKLCIKSCLEDSSAINYEEIGNAQNNIAISYNVKGDYDSALVYFVKALAAFDSIDDKKTKSTVLSNIGDLFLNKNEYKKSEQYYKSSISILSDGMDNHLLASTYLSLGATKSKLLEFDSAFYYIEMAEELRWSNCTGQHFSKL